MKKPALLLLGIALVLAVTPCQATSITFANFGNLGTQDVSLLFSNLTNTLQVVGGTKGLPGLPIKFEFYNVPAAALGEMPAHLMLSATTSSPATRIVFPPAPAPPLGAFLEQPGYGTPTLGSFTITRDSDLVILLSGVFGPANLSGMEGGSSAEFGASTAAGATVVFSSPYVTFVHGEEGFSISMSSVIPVLFQNANNSFLRPFTASETGTFSANLAPEPLTFLLLGSGLVGLGLLRRRRK